MEYNDFLCAPWIYSKNAFRKSFDQRVEHFLHPFSLEKTSMAYLPVKRAQIYNGEADGKLPRLLEAGEEDELPIAKP
jgi:hypothetical protein